GLELRLVYGWTHGHALFAPVADFDLLHPLDKLLDEFVGDRLVQNHAAGRRATLPGRAERALRRAFDGEIEIGIVHHHDRVLAAHLAGDLRQVRRRLLRDCAADLARAGERNRADGRVVHEFVADGAAA